MIFIRSCELRQFRDNGRRRHPVRDCSARCKGKDQSRCADRPCHYVRAVVPLRCLHINIRSPSFRAATNPPPRRRDPLYERPAEPIHGSEMGYRAVRLDPLSSQSQRHGRNGRASRLLIDTGGPLVSTTYPVAWAHSARLG